MAKRSTQIIIHSVVVFVLFLLSFFVSSPVYAQTPSTTIGISPAFQEITLAQGQSEASASVTLKNTTQDTLIFNLRVVEMSQVDGEGQITLVDKPLSPLPDNPEYIQLPSSTIVVPPLSEYPVILSALNLSSLEPGGHYVSLLATQQPTDSTSPAVNLGISSFIIVRKQGGERFHLSLRNSETMQQFFHWNVPPTLSLTFENQGNIHIKPQGQVLIKDIFGRTIYEGTINENSQFVWPGSQRSIDVSLRHLRLSPPLMLYSVSVSGHSGEGEQAFQQSTSWFVASPFGVGGMVGVIFLFIIFLIFRKRSR